MREWMFGDVTGWIRSADTTNRKRTTFLEALGASNNERQILFLYDDNKLICVKDLTSWMRKAAEDAGHKGPMQDKNTGFCLYVIADNLHRRHGVTGWNRFNTGLETEILALLNLRGEDQ